MVHFGDKRLDRRFIYFFGAIVRRCSVILRQLATDRNEEIGFGRFLRHPKVTTDKIFQSAYARTGQASAGQHVLLIQDSSTLGFGLFPPAGQLGPIGDNTSRGFYLHPVIALDSEQGTCLGLASAQLYQRREYEAEDPMADRAVRKSERRKTAFEQKESYRWWSSAEQAVLSTDQATRHTIIADSESDIFDLMVRLDQAQIDFVLRSFQNRTLNYRRSGYNLNEHMTKQAVQASYEVKLPATDKRSAHVAKLQVKWTKVSLARPHDTQNKNLPLTLELTVIEVIEAADSVVNKEKPVHWRLLTSHHVEDFSQALQIIQWYTWRWVIEQLFRSLKRKGLDLQSAQVESPASLFNLTAMSLISAVQIMQLVQARDGNNKLHIKMVFTVEESLLIQDLNPKLEGRTEKLKNPHPIHSLAFAAWVVARLGGWSGYASQRPPGPITMAHGLRRLRDVFFISQLDP